ncbi:gamma-glutamylcyclotransferase [Streptomyces sp. TRM66268-LWL]|uniref:Gamma-glutamylcyclotransferase n=1 Tax=Streptomyces polyasparticus TaxID=2767826 RepID=A0ABR7SEC8_9ACTN|nr:gamma-glutamylcyclotransferase [Streptomyces polyasparticus]
MTEAPPHSLFSFGTLRDGRVQAALFGRTVPHAPAALAGHTTRPLRITDPEVIAASGLEVHLALGRRIGCEVEGAVLALTDRDLTAADDYEVDDYARRRVLLTSGESAWAYLDARPLRPAERIVIVGDSIAYGRCDAGGGWAGRLAATHIAADEVEHRVFNLAVPGSTLREVSEQTPALLGARLPDTLVVAAGINDTAHGGDDGAWLDGLGQSLGSLAATALECGARLVVLGPTWLEEERARAYDGLSFTEAKALALRAALRAWCSARHVDFVDLWEPLQGRPDLLADGLHPTAEGHQAVFEHLMATAS